METYTIQFELKSDTTFGRGDGVSGLVEMEVAHDAQGFPYLNGRTLKGLLTEECDTLLELLSVLRPMHFSEFQQARNWLFGEPGSRNRQRGALKISHARLPTGLRTATAAAGMKPGEVLNSLTTIRRQSAISIRTGAPEPHMLRSTRVILRKIFFVSHVSSLRKLNETEISLVAASVLHWRRAGSIRNRGRGRLVADLKDEKGASLLRKGMQLLEVEV
jgi:hypothetical protein